MLRLTLLFLIIACCPAFTGERPGCELQVPCEVGDRSYHARLPDNWDGRTPLPVLLHFHGWGRQGTLTVKHRRIAGATRKMGVLLLGPNGRSGSWDFWDASSGDIGFAKIVIEDAARRWPINRSKIFVSGYSYGSAMAWRFACAEGAAIHTLLAISGSLRGEEDECASPVNIRHVHGTKDTVMRYPFGPDGDVEAVVALWTARNGCGKKADRKIPWRAVKILPFLRHVWADCTSDKIVVLDVHQRGHFIPRFWIAKQLEELL